MSHDVQFATRLRLARIAKGWTQTELADRCGLQAGEINHYEAGRRLPSFENLRVLIIALGADANQLLGIPR